ncbi:secreted protein [Melampsora americana]|nr:secreted protein [Melampsora americana]
MKQRVLLVFLSIFAYFDPVLSNLFTKVDVMTRKDDDALYIGLAGKNDIRIEEVFWDIGHDNSWNRLMATAQSSAKDARTKIRGCERGENDCGPETLLSMIMEVNEVFVTITAPEHHDVLQDLKYDFIKQSNRLWNKYKSGDRIRSVDETAQHILKSALAFKIFQGQKNLFERYSTGQTQHHLSAAFFTSGPAYLYAEGFQASIGFVNIVENLVMDGLKEEKVFRQFPLEQGAPKPFRRRLTHNKTASRIMHQDALLTWWRSQLSVKAPYEATSEIHLEGMKDEVRGLKFIGSKEHINVWKRLLGVVVTTGASKREIQDKLSLLQNYSQARIFFERLMHNNHEHNLGILKALYEILEIFETCDGRRDKKSFMFVQDVVNELFIFNERNLASQRNTIVQRAKYMVMWWMLSQSIARTVSKFGTDHGKYFEEVNYSRVLQYMKYLWHFMYKQQKLGHIKYIDRQEREYFTLGKHYFIYIGCQLHLQDLISNNPSHLWSMTAKSIGIHSLTKILSLDKGNVHPLGIEKDLNNLFFESMRASALASNKIAQANKEAKSSTGIKIQDRQRLPEKRKFSSSDVGKQLKFPGWELPRVRSADVPDDDIEEGEIVEKIHYRAPGSPRGFDKFHSDSPHRDAVQPSDFNSDNSRYTSSGSRQVLDSLSQDVESIGEGNTRLSSGIDNTGQNKQRLPKRRKFTKKDEDKQVELSKSKLIKLIPADHPMHEVEEGEIVDEMEDKTLKSPSGFEKALPKTDSNRGGASKFYEREKEKSITSDHKTVLQSHSQDMSAMQEGDSQVGDLSFDELNHKAIKNMNLEDPKYNDIMHDFKEKTDVILSPRTPPTKHHLINTSKELYLSQLFQELFGEESPKHPSSTKDLQAYPNYHNTQSNDLSDDWAKIKVAGEIDMSSVKDHNLRISPKIKQHSTPSDGGIQKSLEIENKRSVSPKIISNMISDTEEPVLDILEENDLIKASSSQMIPSRTWKGKSEESEKDKQSDVTNPTYSSSDNFARGDTETDCHTVKSSPVMDFPSTHLQDKGKAPKVLHSGTNIDDGKHNSSEEGTSLLVGSIAIQDLPPKSPPRTANTGEYQVIPSGFRLFGVDIRPGDQDR